MAVQEGFLPTRKAFSAERSKDVYESPSSDSGLEEIGNKTFKVCSSASILSARERRHAQKALEYSMQEEFSPRYHKLHNKENQKLFLQASQILEKLNKLTSSIESQNNAAVLRNSKMRKIAVYHDKLRQLLIERSSLLLIEESVNSIKRTTKCIDDFKHIYFSEKLKMTTMPTQAFNRFVSSSDINISSLELLIKKLNTVCDMHTSLTNNYQNLINLFHAGANIDLNKTISESYNILNSLETDVFYWCHRCMEVFIQKVCLADPNSVSPDFLLKILRAIHIYNSLLNRGRNSQCKLLTTDYIFYRFILKQEKNILSFDLILQNLSFFEAKVAAERIVSFLSTSCKKHKQADLKQKLLKSDEKLNNTVAEFSTVLNYGSLEPSKIKSSSPIHTNNFANMLLAIIQRNQSLILKYMYSITSLEGLLVLKTRRTYENLTPTSSARQMWDLPQLYNIDDNYTLLEEGYWTNFWRNIKTFILKLLFDVPYHQYGDSAIGTIILWPDSFFKILSETLKISINNKDFSMEGQCVFKELHDCLIIHQGKLLWDKEFSVSLPAIQSHLYAVITNSQNQMRTHPGNSLYKCLCLLLSNCSENVQERDLMTSLPVFLHLQAVIDSYISWVNVKSRALIASQNLSTLLLICSSDCNDASQLLQDKVSPAITELSSSTSVKRLHPSFIPFLKSIFKQIDLIYNYKTEVPTILQKFCVTAVKETLMFLIRSSKTWQNCIDQEVNFCFDSVMNFLSPMTEVLKQLLNVYPFILSITSGVCQGFLLVLNSMKRKLRRKKIQILVNEHTKFLQWLERLNLSQSDLNSVKKSVYFEKLYHLLNLLLKLLNKPKCSLTRRNRITPHTQSEEIPLENILTKADVAHWKEKCSQPICFLCM